MARAVGFHVDTGLRPGEAIAVRWQDINWDAATLHVMQAVSGDGKDMELTPTKTERSTRPVALGPHCLALLRDRQSEQRIERAHKGSAWEDQDLVFSTRDGRLLSPNNIRPAFRKDRDSAGLSTAIHPHCLRHSMASHWLAAGHSIKVVSERLGHTSVAFTLQTYAHLLPNQQADAAAAMDAALFADPIPTPSPRTSELGDTAPNAIHHLNAETGSAQRFGEQEQTVRDLVNTPVYDS